MSGGAILARRLQRRGRNPITPKAAPGHVAWAQLNIKRMRVPRDVAVVVRGGITRAADVYAMLAAEAHAISHEKFWVVPLDLKNKPLAIFQTSQGILDASLVHPREVFAPAILSAAAGIIMAHNHPSGDPEPSPEDVALTRRIASAGQILGLPVLDHVIIGRTGYVSFQERGMI